MALQLHRAIPRPTLCLRFSQNATRSFSLTERRRIDDPVKNVANAINQGKDGPTEPASIPTRPASSPNDDRNPALYPSADTLPRPNNKADRQTPDASLHAQQVHNAAHCPESTQALSGLRSSTTAATADQQHQKQPLTQAERLTAIINRNASRQADRKQDALRAEQAKSRGNRIRLMEQQQKRIWREGDVYAPHDLSPVEQNKAQYARTSRPAKKLGAESLNSQRRGWRDIIDELGVDPLKEYKNFAMMSELIGPLGRIRHRRETGFRGVNQRKAAKAVRRAIALGFLPSVHRHPELHPDRVGLRGRGTGSVKFDTSE